MLLIRIVNFHNPRNGPLPEYAVSEGVREAGPTAGLSRRTYNVPNAAPQYNTHAA
jgi:hypothetical protein